MPASIAQEQEKKAVLLMNSIGVRFSLNQMILLRLRDLKITATGWY